MRRPRASATFLTRCSSSYTRGFLELSEDWRLSKTARTYTEKMDEMEIDLDVGPEDALLEAEAMNIV